jgi:hypothetical protein
MWDTATDITAGHDYAGHAHLSHEMPCTSCGHAPHTYLPCSDTCDCVPPSIPGQHSGHLSGASVNLVLI